MKIKITTKDPTNDKVGISMFYDAVGWRNDGTNLTIFLASDNSATVSLSSVVDIEITGKENEE